MKTNLFLFLIFLCYSTCTKSDKNYKNCIINKRKKLQKLMESMEKIRADKMTINNSVSKNPRKDQNELANQQYCNIIITRICMHTELFKSSLRSCSSKIVFKNSMKQYE